MSKYTKASSRIRIIVLAVMILLIFAASSVRLMQFQIVEGAQHYKEAITKSTSSYTIPASRGDIVDRYGRVLIGSKISFNVVFDWGFVDRENLNQTIHSLIQLFEKEQVMWINELPIEYNGGNYQFKSDEDDVDAMKNTIKVQLYATEQNCVDKMMENYEINYYPILADGDHYQFDESRSREVKQLIADLGLPEEATADECMTKMLENPSEYPIYSQEDAFQIAAVRYSMEKRQFSATTRYVFSEDVSENMLIKVKELGSQFPGVDVMQSTSREFLNEDVASHLLGTVGPIYKEEYEELRQKGYQLNDTVGKSGIEKVMEDELRGENGKMTIVQNATGDIIQEIVDREAIAGNTVRLTIDYEFQKRVQEILKNFMNSNYSRTPHDSPGAAIVVLDNSTGECLALASYPNYTLEQYKTNYESLESDPLMPMFNRALQGTYAPGSSFKPIVGIAGISESLETRDSTINCSNPYREFGETYQPRCLQDHHSGPTNILNALKWSCNIYFYDVGRRLGIDKIYEYATQMGLGVDTGLELPAATGVVANYELSVQRDKIWNPGTVAQASIGQNYTQITPLSMACEAMTIANKGVRYETHLVDAILDYEGNLLKETEPVVANEDFTISDEAYEAVKDGMILAGQRISGVNNLTTLSYPVAVKTGTPQTISPKHTNNDFIAFTINGGDSISISCMIEGASSGASSLIRQVLDAYDLCKILGELESTPQYPQDLNQILS